MATKVAILGLAGAGLNLALGHGGLVSFGHAAFVGIGAYAVGSPTSSAPDARRLAISCGMRVYSIKYTTAIHAPHPAAVNDAEAGYRALLANGYKPSQIVIAGTSAGGGLALGLLHRLISQGIATPACVVTLSAWLDLTLSFPSIDRLAKRDVILSRDWLTRARELYCPGEQRQHPETSPFYGDFAGSPPQLLLFSEAELFRDEIEAFAMKLQGLDVSVELGRHCYAPHAWPMVVENAPESEAAFALIARFVAKHLDASLT